MAAALPPEVRAVLSVLIAAHDAGEPRPGIVTLRKRARRTERTVILAADWLERRGCYAVPTIEARRWKYSKMPARRTQHIRQWHKATLDVPAARALLGGAS